MPAAVPLRYRYRRAWVPYVQLRGDAMKRLMEKRPIEIMDVIAIVVTATLFLAVGVAGVLLR